MFKVLSCIEIQLDVKHQFYLQGYWYNREVILLLFALFVIIRTCMFLRIPLFKRIFNSCALCGKPFFPSPHPHGSAQSTGQKTTCRVDSLALPLFGALSPAFLSAHVLYLSWDCFTLQLHFISIVLVWGRNPSILLQDTYKLNCPLYNYVI